MIALPPGVTVNHEVTIVVDELNVDMLDWYTTQGGRLSKKSWYDARGKEHEEHVVSYGYGRPSYKTVDGTTNHLLRFHQEDAGAALVFLLKFNSHVTAHNMKEVEQYVY